MIFTSLLSASVDVIGLAEKYGAVCKWDYWRDIGLIEKGGKSISFRPGDSFLIEGMDTKYAVDFIRRNEYNRVVAGPQAEQIIKDLLAEDRDADRQMISAIILDPGHGGKDSGAVSPFTVTAGSRLMEKDVVLDISMKLYASLRRRYPNKKIILTRDVDKYLTLEQRTDKANSVSIGQNEAVLFVSVHANASIRRTASGFEVWYLPPEMRRDMVSDQMRASNPAEVVDILNRLIDEETTVESIKLADSILNGMAGEIAGRSLNRGLKEEAWYVVRNAKMPSVLIEVGFVSNKREAEMLASDYYRQDLSDGIYNGINRFVDEFEKSNGFTENGRENE